MKTLEELCEVNPKSKIFNSEYIDYLNISGCVSLSIIKIKNDNTLPSRAKRTVLNSDIILSSVRSANKNLNIYW